MLHDRHLAACERIALLTAFALIPFGRDPRPAHHGCDNSRVTNSTAPYNYGLQALPPEKLFGPELTGCSTPADNCHDADERGFGKASKIFRMLKNISPVSGKLRTARS
jgi:hypothetical protein